MISISSYQVKISGLYPLLNGFTALNRIGEILIKRLIIILIKRLTKETFNSIYKKLNICQIQDIWKLIKKKIDSSDMMFIFDPQCHTLVTFF